MNISILILTHNRPKLFQRCIDSILNNIPKNVEILVNNDSKDIQEIPHPQISYYYESSEDLSDIYKFLYSKSNNGYIYYLEDDDYVLPNFWKVISELKHHDIYYMNYIKADTFIPKKNIDIEIYNIDFQLSQILFKKELITEFPKGNDLYNDWNLFQNIKANTADIYIIKKAMFKQTTDGKDNISFSEYSKDKKWLNL